jgi:hypothetical protein
MLVKGLPMFGEAPLSFDLNPVLNPDVTAENNADDGALIVAAQEAAQAQQTSELGPEPTDPEYQKVKQAVENTLTIQMARITEGGDNAALTGIKKTMERYGINSHRYPHLDKMVKDRISDNWETITKQLKALIGNLPTIPAPEYVQMFIASDIDYLNTLTRGAGYSHLNKEVIGLAKLAYDTYINDVTSERKVAANSSQKILADIAA